MVVEIWGKTNWCELTEGSKENVTERELWYKS